MRLRALPPSAAPVQEPLAAVSQLVGRAVVNRAGDEVGRVVDLVVRQLGSSGYPLIAGLVVKVGRRRSFVEGGQVDRLDGDRVTLSSARMVIDEFRRRAGEVSWWPTSSTTSSSTWKGSASFAPPTCTWPGCRAAGTWWPWTSDWAPWAGD